MSELDRTAHTQERPPSRRVDWRVWLPAIVALGCLVPRALPRFRSTTGADARAVALPEMRSFPVRAKLRHYELQSDSSHVSVSLGESAGATATGTMRTGPGAREGVCEVEVAVSNMPVLRLLLRRIEVQPVAIPGCRREVWALAAAPDTAVLCEAILWHCQLPGQRLRTQSAIHLTAETAAAMGLEGRWAEGLDLGLDLSWRPVRPR
ncbi:MAG: hypothetical protein AB8H80_00270 [Planctomycetota bacterium]